MTRTSYLIEHVMGADVRFFRTYWCGPGDWCCNPHHAFQFPDREAAENVRGAMRDPAQGKFVVTEHQWQTPPEFIHEEAVGNTPASDSGDAVGVSAPPAADLPSGFDPSD